MYSLEINLSCCERERCWEIKLPFLPPAFASLMYLELIPSPPLLCGMGSHCGGGSPLRRGICETGGAGSVGPEFSGTS